MILTVQRNRIVSSLVDSKIWVYEKSSCQEGFFGFSFTPFCSFKVLNPENQEFFKRSLSFIMDSPPFWVLVEV